MKKLRENEQQTEETFKVPADLLLDILSILVGENLQYEVTQVIESKKVAIINVQIDTRILRQVKAKENIEGILKLYEEYRFNDNEEADWREN